MVDRRRCGRVAAWRGAAGLAQQGGLPVISSQMQHARGQNVVPLYRGWFAGADGRTYAAFEYLNRNSAETLDIPIGADNRFTPGPADRGQPTHFLPGHRAGVFAVPLPEGSTEEINWTLRVRGATLTVPSNLGRLYEIEGLVDPAGAYPGNTPPVVRLAPDGPSGQGPGGLTGSVVATAGEATALRVWATDDGLPPLPDPDKVLRSLQAEVPGGRPRHGGRDRRLEQVPRPRYGKLCRRGAAGRRRRRGDHRDVRSAGATTCCARW